MAKKKTETKAAEAPFGQTDAPTRATLLHSMLLQRRFEERCAEAYALGRIGGFCHLYIGQEACGTGAISVLRPDDYVITTYRDHGQALARGITPRLLCIGDLKTVRRAIPKSTKNLGRREGDPPAIVEVWL